MRTLCDRDHYRDPLPYCDVQILEPALPYQSRARGIKHAGRCSSITTGTLMGTPNWKPQEYSGKIIEYKDPGRHIPTIFLPLHSWGSLFGVPSKVLLVTG